MSRRHFGSVRRLPSGRYQASYFYNAERHIAPDTFPAKADAQRWLSETETKISRGEWVDPAGGRMTVRELSECWRSSDPSKRTNTKARDEAILRLHILPTLGDRALREVTPNQIQRLVNGWAAEKAPRTARRHYDVVRAMFSYAVQSDWIARSPCRNIKLPKVTSTRHRALDPADVDALADAIDQRYRTMVLIGAVLGLRWAEVAGLTVGSLDLLRHTLTVSHQLDRDRLRSAPKTDAGRRTMSIPEELSIALAAHLAAQGLTGAVPERLLFADRSGQPLDYSHWRQRVWLPAVNKAGLAGAGFHDLRRANATYLVAGGVDVKTAQTRLGHADPRTTLAIYARAVPKSDRAAADVLGRTFFGKPEEEIAHGSRTK